VPLVAFRPTHTAGISVGSTGEALLLDLNVFLDVILDRPPDADVAAALWGAIERGQGYGMVPAHGVPTIFYMLEKARDAAFARQGVERLIGVFHVAPVDDNVVRRALALAWPDFEDAVCAAAAEASACDALVTRDPDGYPNPPLPVIDPAGALSWITQE
jgi:predicted nucleic acid-binding protein